MLLVCAQTVWPVVGEPVWGGGAVAVEGGVIRGVGKTQELAAVYAGAQQIDLGDCVLLPGLINAHTHLELSDLRGRVSFCGSFVDWISRLAAARRRYQGDLGDVIAAACRESVAGGVTTVGDICLKHRAWVHLAAERIRKVCFAEVFGLTGPVETAREYLLECLRDTEQGGLLRLGFSPHAPYSTVRGVYEMAAALAGRSGLALTTHLAETTEEVQFLADGGGDWGEYLRSIHKWDGSFAPPGRTPVDYFLRMKLGGEPFLLAHVNYLGDEELTALARSGHSVAYCPRSHAFFGHPAHRWREMLAAGVNVCLGTDSLASNESLSILDELRFLYGRHRDVDTAMLVKMATINGARALRWEDRIGSLEVGKEADMIAVPLGAAAQGSDAAGALRDVLAGSARPRVTMVAGEVVYRG